jgi:hypothetical protein
VPQEAPPFAALPRPQIACFATDVFFVFDETFEGD